jgi:predicted nucleic acid-binding protein
MVDIVADPVRPNRVVIDSSVAAKWFVGGGETGVEAAFELLRAHQADEVRLCAPSLVLLEVLNALRFRGLEAAVLDDCAAEMLAIQLGLEPLEPLAQRAAVLSAAHSLTVYDASFVALAERLDCELVTADQRLADCPACRTRLL